MSGAPVWGARLTIIPARRGLTTKPSEASFSASPKRLFQGSLPCSPWAWARAATAPGAPVDLPLRMAAKKLIGLPSGPRNRSGPEAAGAVSRPS